ncbi:acyltransferase family protein [Methylococcus mesophilus]|uniref:acyltransferase family protein n=1 Tax=Methylococcus mesophilus TaxID=2993564 RepID=UPI00224A8A16|nr:acyltransferase family protein [Methylococcus mesophilus]UZR28732.1 acyltransferase family protein [Methylococcus mesophilus]
MREILSGYITGDSFRRTDIDGLRAIAVISVLFYHSGVPAFSGGYVGVDVFFVISGFLITRIIDTEIREKRFSLSIFYERRIRRIAPALFCMTLCSLLVGFAELFHLEFEFLGKSAIASSLFYSNIFMRRTVGYFMPSAETMPLMHTWSLAVEEQYYILFPIVFMATAVWFAHRKFVFLSIIFLTSLAASAFAIGISRHAVFYLTPFRIWELLTGSLLAVGCIHPLPQRRALEALALIGIALILGPVFLYDHRTTFPGLAALPPCLGTALLIYAGGRGSTIVNRLLSARVLVFVGLISYSLYLWHWPVIVFVRRVLGPVESSWMRSALAIIFSFLFAMLSWRYVEQPFRRSDWIGRRTIFGGFFVGLAVICIFSAVIIKLNGFPDRFSSDIRALAEPEPVKWMQTYCRYDTDGLCYLGSENTTAPIIFVWGDSHAHTMLPAIEHVARLRGRRLIVASGVGCTPLLGVKRVDEITDICTARAEKALLWILSHKKQIDNVVLVGRWGLYETGYFNESGLSFRIADSYADAGRTEEAVTNAIIIQRAMRRTISAISIDGGLPLILIGLVPEIGWEVPSTAAASRQWGWEMPPTPNLRDVRIRNTHTLAVIEDMSSSVDLKLLSVADVICKPDCPVVKHNRALYSDDNHMTPYAVVTLLQHEIEAILR